MQNVNDCDTSSYGQWNTIFGDSVRPVKKKKRKSNNNYMQNEPKPYYHSLFSDGLESRTDSQR